MKHEKTHSQILKTSRSGRAIKAIVSNTSQSREGSSDKENLDGINNSNSDQKCNKKHLENPALNTKLKGPKIIKEEGNDWAFNEGCLSIPDVREDVFRKDTITIEYCEEDFVRKKFGQGSTAADRRRR